MSIVRPDTEDMARLVERQKLRIVELEAELIQERATVAYWREEAGIWKKEAEDLRAALVRVNANLAEANKRLEGF